MALFGIKTEWGAEAFKFVDDTNERLQNENLINNPFIGFAKHIPKHPCCYVFSIEPVYPKIYQIGFILLTMSVIITQELNLWSLPGLMISSLYFLWSSTFYRIMLRMGLRKAGYTGKITHIKKSAIIRLLFNIIQ